MGQAGMPLVIQFAVVDQTLAGASIFADNSKLSQSSRLRVSASPNPGAKAVSILTEGHPDTRVEVVILNQYGGPLRRMFFEADQQEVSRFRVDVSDLPTGSYLIQAQLGISEKGCT